MKQFADLHLHPNLNDRKEVETLIGKVSDLGYRLVGVSLPARAKQDTVRFLRRTCRDQGLDFATRVDLTPKSPNELLKALRRIRRRFELVSVNCSSKPVARQAAKDHRVDLLASPSTNPRKRFFDLAEARLAAQSVATLEIDMTQLLSSAGFARARLLSCLRQETALAQKMRIPIVISSNAASSHELRGPHDFASLATLFGMDSASGLDAVSTSPSAIVERNRRKLDPGYVARGIRIVRRGKDCVE